MPTTAFKTSSPTHPTGEMARYTDATGRKQTSVKGPNGTVLITNKRDGDPYNVWWSDAITNITTTTNKNHALDVAFRKAGIEF